MNLTPAMERFVVHWGEMGTRWGINRTVAQIHALLIISPKPLPADEIATTLDVARSNVSMSLKELQSWGLIKSQHLLGDRRDHFTTAGDMWSMFRLILAERKRREVDPSVAVVQACLRDCGDTPAEAHAAQQWRDLLALMELMTGCYELLRDVQPTTLRRLMAVGELAGLRPSGQA
jgi:DNA-binding transcriptional regulator GbsR (MarR family)